MSDLEDATILPLPTTSVLYNTCIGWRKEEGRERANWREAKEGRRYKMECGQNKMECRGGVAVQKCRNNNYCTYISHLHQRQQRKCHP
jgi:hypothetical protein